MSISLLKSVPVWRYGQVEVTPAIFSSGKCGFTTRLIVLVAYANCITEFCGWIPFTCPDQINLSVLCDTSVLHHWATVSVISIMGSEFHEPFLSYSPTITNIEPLL